MKTHRILSGLGPSGIDDAADRLSDTRPATVGDTPSTAATTGTPPSAASSRRAASAGVRGRRRMSSSIRHSSVEGFEFDPLTAAVQARKEKEKRRQRDREEDRERESTRSSSTANEIEPPTDLDEEDVIRRERVKEAGQLASVFLEMRKDISDVHNVHSGSTAERSERDQQPERHHIRASRTTIQRAERTKVMMNLKYFSLFKSQKRIHDPPKFEGVDGVYNPLQIIRNRKVRKKFHQPAQLSIKTIPAASEAFSKNKTKMLWQVDLEEIAHDINWRAHHWHDLINPQGELWFPPEQQAHGSHHRHRPHFHHHKDNDESSYEHLTGMHDRLFQSADEDSSKESSKDDLLDVPRARKRDMIANKIRKRSKSPFKRGSNHEVTTELTKINNDQEAPSSGSSVYSQPHIQFSSPTPNPSQTQFHQTSSSLGLLNDINIEPVHAHERVVSNASGLEISTNSSSSKAPTTSTHTRNGSTNIIPSLENAEATSKDAQYEEFKLQKEIMSSLRASKVLSEYDIHSIGNRRSQYTNVVNYARLFQDHRSVEELTESLKVSVLKPYEISLDAKAERLQSIHNELATDFSTRVDQLLLLSDRTIGEVNTTLALEARNLTERYEKLGPLHRRKDALVWFAYWLLENLVVLLLWIIWIGFSLGRMLKFVVLCTWNTVQWFINN
ncbi:Maintenance of telomere capping protein 4 [Cyberlindnera fabianii]|uniref:Maintenance of telomere capping protein 4 n=1 Tax=Cyberlindnera fabianii TaxID=36022 RepID=A0A1V2LDT7_CYBFA|nr:Maintenance of telomere capping protein 4 [Cyberlindnera fabianii]